MTSVKVRIVFAWYDLWVGAFIDRPRRRIYVFPLPCLGFCVELPIPEPVEVEGSVTP